MRRGRTTLTIRPSTLVPVAPVPGHRSASCKEIIETRAFCNAAYFDGNFYIIGGHGRKIFKEIIEYSTTLRTKSVYESDYNINLGQAMVQLDQFVILNGGDSKSHINENNS